MRTTDIYYFNVVLRALGYKERDLAFVLGTQWKTWSSYHVERLRDLLRDRIDILERDGRAFKSLHDLAEQFREIDKRIVAATQFERVLISKRTKITLDELRDLALENETTVRNIEKAMRAMKWKRSKEGRKVVWRSS